LLGFGLMVQMPAKFFGAKLAWQRLDSAKGQINSTSTGHSFEGYLIQGHEDRSEEIRGDDQHFDTGNVAQDPYAGGALYFGWVPAQNLDFGILVGTLDAGESGGRRNEFMVQSTASALLGTRGPHLGFDFRYAKEKWRLSDQEKPEKIQQSIALTLNLPITYGISGILGLHSGRSERAATDSEKINPVTGYQVELGFYAAMAKDLFFQFLMSHEARTMEDEDGEEIGGFASGDNRRSSLRRFGLEISYRLHQSR